MPEDVLYLEADFADASACDLVHAMLSGGGPAFKEDVAVRFQSLFLLMESEPAADSAERVETLRVRASWDPWPNYEQTARALCEACSRAGAIATWAFFADDTGGAVWTMDEGKLRTVYWYDSESKKNKENEFDELDGFEIIDAARKRDATRKRRPAKS